MLNPIENVWSVFKAAVKRVNRILLVEGPGVGQQRLEYLETVLRGAVAEITAYLCSQTINHCTRIHR